MSCLLSTYSKGKSVIIIECQFDYSERGALRRVEVSISFYENWNLFYGCGQLYLFQAESINETKILERKKDK